MNPYHEGIDKDVMYQKFDQGSYGPGFGSSQLEFKPRHEREESHTAHLVNLEA